MAEKDSETQTPDSNPSPSSPSSPESTPAIKSHLESLSLACITSLNSRNFSPFAPGWNCTSPSWTAEFSNHVNSPQENSSHDLPTFLQIQKDTATQFPEYYMNVTGISSDVDVGKGRASVFTWVEVTGIPVGVVRQSMVHSEYQRVAGRWLCTRCIGVRGVPHLSD